MASHYNPETLPAFTLEPVATFSFTSNFISEGSQCNSGIKYIDLLRKKNMDELHLIANTFVIETDSPHNKK